MFKTILLASVLALVPYAASSEVLSMKCQKSGPTMRAADSYDVSMDTKNKFMIVTIDDSMVPMKVTAVKVTSQYIYVSAFTKYGNTVDATFLNPDWDGNYNREQQFKSYNVRDNVTTTDMCYLAANG